MAISMAAVMLLCGTAIAQPKDAADKGKSDAAQSAETLVGKFTAAELSIVIEQQDGKYRGTITRGGKPFAFTGELKGTALSGLVDVEGTQSGFTATISEDELTLKLGLDSHKLKRVETKPLVPQKGNTIRKEVLLAKSEDVQVDSEIASPDNRRIGFIIQRDGLRFAAIDGIEGKPYRTAGAIEFSPDSKRYTHVGQRADGKLHVIVDGVESEPYDRLWEEFAKFSADSRRFAYAAMRGNKWRAVIDGKESALYDAVRFIAFSPDSKRVAFAGQRGNSWHVVIDGVEQEAVEDVGREGILFSPDSKRVAFTAIKNLKHCLVVDGVAGKAHEAIDGVTFSPDSLHTYFVALRSGQYEVFTDGEEKGTYEKIYGLSFGPDGKSTVLAVRKEGKALHLINDRSEPGHEDISPPVFSPDGKLIVYATKKDGKWSVLHDGKSGKAHDQIPFIAFAPDSRRLAYVAIDGEKAKVVVDGDSTASLDEIWHNGLYFSPDSKHLVVGARREDKSFLIVGGIEGEPIGAFVPGSQPVFDGPDQFHIITRRGPHYYRLEVRILASGPANSSKDQPVSNSLEQP